MQNIWNNDYTLRANDFDKYDRILPSSVLSIFQDAAGRHGEEIGVGFKEMLDEAGSADLVLFCYEGENTKPIGAYLSADELRKISEREHRKPKIAIVVGSEGGFSEKEAAEAETRGFRMCGLGKRILRTETAAMFALCCLVYETELS